MMGVRKTVIKNEWQDVRQRLETVNNW